MTKSGLSHLKVFFEYSPVETEGKHKTVSARKTINTVETRVR